ncbi:hypothetical protein [Saccharothrix sp.]|uniref:hypothetical protein n=1 Tax=Saccharothrix sp. TaxID=1873460 RepID=UPI0028124D85|nr:hypothetical protein [Saccharothrix sp.]
MSTVSATKPTSTARVRFIAWSLVCLGAAGFVTVLVNPVVGLVVGLAVAVVGLAVSALTRASRTFDRILDEELDSRPGHDREHGRAGDPGRGPAADLR